MSRIGFRVTPHSVLPGVDVAEVTLDGIMVATIYPDQKKPQSIKIVSAHFAGEVTRSNQFPDGVRMDTGERVIPPIPTVEILFNPCKFIIDGDHIVRKT